MQNLHVLYQLLVPALFLVLWALNQLFNKEASGANRPGGGLGPRPGGPPPTPRPRPVHRPEPIGARPAGEEEILILEAEPRRSPEPRRTPAATPRKPARSPSAGRPSQKSTSSPATSTALNSQTGKPGSFAETSSLTAQTTQTTQVSSSMDSPFATRPIKGLPVGALTSALRDPARLREAILLQEVLKPPVSKRGRGL